LATTDGGDQGGIGWGAITVVNDNQFAVREGLLLETRNRKTKKSGAVAGRHNRGDEWSVDGRWAGSTPLRRFRLWLDGKTKQRGRFRQSDRDRFGQATLFVEDQGARGNDGARDEGKCATRIVNR
jgi:hypothetical protein